ncbi:MAG: hypothetical protein ABFS34_04500 [Gemmatimonadota bacterium]
MMTRLKGIAVLTLALAALAPAAGVDAQVRTDRRPGRAALEQRFHRQFMERSRRQLDLQEGQSQRLEDVLRRGRENRRELQRQLMQERHRFIRAIEDANTSDDEFRRRLGAMEDLRRREYELWRSEQDALAGFMTPRQRASFMQLQMHMNDAVRNARRRDQDKDDSDRPPR